MPDRRQHRGAHPQDCELFAPAWLPKLRLAVEEYAWLLSRGYSPAAALTLVGDHHELTARQRLALMRSTCSDAARAGRVQRRVSTTDIAGQPLAIDGYNVLITLESALSSGLILRGCDGCCRDLASVHGTYRRVAETEPALTLLIDAVDRLTPAGVDFYLDEPVSNSGRLKVRLAELLEARPPGACSWNLAIVRSPDALLIEHAGVVATTDSAILDRAARWLDLAGTIIAEHIPAAWIVGVCAETRP